MDRLQPRHELETQEPAERKGYRALAMGIDGRSTSISVQWRMTPSIIDPPQMTTAI
jgi:hypothetical protein